MDGWWENLSDEFARSCFIHFVWVYRVGWVGFILRVSGIILLIVLNLPSYRIPDL
jgi:hypothetical protein